MRVGEKTHMGRNLHRKGTICKKAILSGLSPRGYPRFLPEAPMRLLAALPGGRLLKKWESSLTLQNACAYR
jgi:hypothetical protein